MKQALALSQAALNLAAKDPKNRPEIRGWLTKAKQLRERTVREHEANIAKLDGLIQRIGIALGEVSA